MNLGATLTKIRRRKQLKQGELAEQCGITQTYLSQIENNRKEPNTALLRNISSILNIPLPVIFFLAMEEADFPEKERQHFSTICKLVRPFFEDVFNLNGKQ
jgi:transcriptional regulator with XRE-family HTH domain